MEITTVVLIALVVAIVVFAFAFLLIKRPQQEKIVFREIEKQRQDRTHVDEPQPERPKTRLIVQLIVTNPQGKEKNYQIESDVFNIGREEDENNLILDPTDTTTGRYHARIRREGEKATPKYIIADLDSLLGTLVNGKKIQEKQELHDGDKIIIGKTQISFVFREFEVL